jgi:hypothetical protein
MDLLNRITSADDLRFYSEGLDSGGLTRREFAFDTLDTTAHRTEEIKDTYERFLKRPPTGQELDDALDDFFDDDNPISSEGFQRDLLESNEYFNTRGGGTGDGFLDALFMDLLCRPPRDSQERQFIRQGLDLNAAADRREAARRVMDTEDYCDKLARLLFERFLRRPPASSSADRSLLANLAEKWDAGADEEDLIADLLANDAYFNNAGCIATLVKGDMPGNAFFQIALGIVPTVPGTNVNLACVTSGNDPNDANNLAHTPTVAQSPRLTITLSNGVVVIEWPVAARGFTLECTTNLTDWQAVTNRATKDSATRRVRLPLDPTRPVTIYRLTTGRPDYCLTAPGGSMTVAFNSLTGEYCLICPSATIPGGTETRQGRGKVTRTGTVVRLEDSAKRSEHDGERTSRGWRRVGDVQRQSDVLHRSRRRRLRRLRGL